MIDDWVVEMTRSSEDGRVAAADRVGEEGCVLGGDARCGARISRPAPARIARAQFCISSPPVESGKILTRGLSRNDLELIEWCRGIGRPHCLRSRNWARKSKAIRRTTTGIAKSVGAAESEVPRRNKRKARGRVKHLSLCSRALANSPKPLTRASDFRFSSHPTSKPPDIARSLQLGVRGAIKRVGNASPKATRCRHSRVHARCEPLAVHLELRLVCRLAAVAG